MIYVGIDPGVTGCVVVIEEDGTIQFHDTPVNQICVNKKSRSVYDVTAMLAILKQITPGNVLVTIEELHAMPKNGGCGNFSSGYGYGLWVGLLTACGLPYQTVQPMRWKRVMGLKKVDGNDTAKKNADRMMACQLFPAAADHMNLQKHHGRADALLIASYTSRIITNPPQTTPALSTPISIK